MAKRTNQNYSNEYGAQQSSSFAQPNLPPIKPVNRRTNMPLTRQQMMEEQQRRLQLERKRKAVANRKKYYRDQATGKKKKVDPNKRYRLEKEKRIKKGRDYFFVMRKFVCFLLFLFFAVSIGLFVVGYLGKFTEYTSLFVEPDLTPQEERITEDEEEPYVDKTEHFTTMDPIFGFVKQYGPDLGPSPKYDQMMEKAEVGYADKIAGLAVEYFPIALVLYILTALISMIRAFLGMFGRRVFRMFGLSAIWMLLMALVVAFAGIVYNLPLEAELTFDHVAPFLIYIIMAVDGAPVTIAGLGLLAMILIPILILFFSIFARKKVPFSIFD